MFSQRKSRGMSHGLYWLSLLICLIDFTACATPFLNTYLDAGSRALLRNVFNDAIKSKDLAVVHHGVIGLKKLDHAVEDATNSLCTLANTVDQKVLTQLYHATAIASALSNCNLATSASTTDLVNAVLKEQPNSQTIFLALAVAKNLKMKIDNNEYAKALTAALAKDDGAISLTYGLNAAALLDKVGAEKFFARVENLVGQLDEVDGKYLHLDGGFSITAFGVYGIYALADKLNKSPNVKSDEAVKLANYLLTQRMTQHEVAAYMLVLTLSKLANNNFQIPVVFSLASNMAVSDTTKPIRIRVSNVLGESVGPLSVNLDAATHLATKEAVITRTSMKFVDSDATKTLYELDISSLKKQGFYNFALSAGSRDKRLVGTNGAHLAVKVLTKVRIEDISIAVFDREVSKPTYAEKIKEGSKLGRMLEADSHNKMEIKFVVKEASTGQSITVHQAFVAFIHAASKQEIIFVATPDPANVYIFDVDLEKSAIEFEGLSGKYNVRLIVGDASVSHSFDWNLVDVNLKLPALPAKKVKNSEQISYIKLPEILHKFREPEKRPPNVVADTFTVLCVLPLLILLIMWLRIGINFGNMPVSPFIFVFHGGLIGIFSLYFLFWLRLNMFETLKYLSIIGAVTFFAGNRLLRTLAFNRKEKTA